MNSSFNIETIESALTEWKDTGEDFYENIKLSISEPFHQKDVEVWMTAIWVVDIKAIAEALRAFGNMTTDYFVQVVPHLRAQCIDILSIDHPNIRQKIDREWSDTRIVNAVHSSAVNVYTDDAGEIFLSLVGNADWSVEHGLSVTWRWTRTGFILERVGDDDDLHVNDDRKLIYASIDGDMCTQRA
ncbi:DUF6985 domain-containing protein [Flexibacterium corallicola]|uniref:DUF6985 domain-containing protein n=1 Tax=Flexibacterium corallicola TaxID=3037259 RepID=UPI00286F49F6|nr:hypothetical protein [Pseudovibrio sp. M1P-2-3]